MPTTVTLKDYYQILEIDPTASQEEVRKAHRMLARKYHPDVNKDSAYASDYFREVQEAYQILKEPVLRKQYDEQRWLYGMSNRAKNTQTVTALWVLEESRKLSAHLVGIDTFRMSHEALYSYMQLLLSDAHMAVLKESEDEAARAQIVAHLLQATKGLKHKYQTGTATLLHAIALEEGQQLAIQQQLRLQQRKEKRDTALPYIAVLITIVLCIFMVLWSR
ncbi:MAG: DnaJ domain-containing protein [Flavipsychrobacter sp.]